MAIDNKDKKVLKSSIEREQNELACSAEREKIKGSKNLNVPHLRFPEFTKEWEMASLQDIAAVNPKSNPLQNSFVYIDLEAVEKGELRKIQEVMREEAPSRAQRVIYKNDILFQCVRPYQKNNYIHKIQSKSNQQWVASTGYAQIRTTEIPNYIYHLLNTDGFNRKVMVRCTGSSYPAINSEDLATIRFYLTTDTKEQLKISRLLDLLDERIATQNKIIEDLKLLKSAIVDKLTTPQKEWKSTKIGNVLSIGSGRDYKHLEDGNIPVYGTGGYMLSVDSYLYDGESVCIGRKGTINKPIFLKGKFWTVDTLFYTHTFRSITPRFCYYLFTTIDWLKYNEASGVPSLSKVTIENISISIPDLVTQKQLCAVLDSMTDKLDIEQKLLDAYHAQKQYLLQQIFI